MTEDKMISKATSDTAPTITSNDYKKSGEVTELNNIPPDMAAAISAVVANRKAVGNSTMRVVTAEEMKKLQEAEKVNETESALAVTEEMEKVPEIVEAKDQIDYGYPIRMTLKFLDNTVEGAPHVMTIRRLDYLDPETDNEEFPEYSRWFMSNLPAHDENDPSAYDPKAKKVYTFKAETKEEELGAFDVIKYLPYIGSTWDYSVEADLGEKTGKMVPASNKEVVYTREDVKTEVKETETIVISSDKVKKND